MQLRLVDKIEEALGTKSFFWEPEQGVTFIPGQYLYYTLPKLNYPDPRGATRQFTISSSPTESRTLRLTTRIRESSGFKKTLDELPIGSEVTGEGPNGSFVLDNKETGPQILLAGGIGITPFRSFIKYNIDKALKIPMYLIYSNSDDEFVFKKDLDSWSNAFVKVGYHISSVSGHLDLEKIENFLKSWQLEPIGVTFWTVGPTAFVSAVENILDSLKISPDKNRTEKFTGY